MLAGARRASRRPSRAHSMLLLSEDGRDPRRGGVICSEASQQLQAIREHVTCRSTRRSWARARCRQDIAAPGDCRLLGRVPRDGGGRNAT